MAQDIYESQGQVRTARDEQIEVGGVTAQQLQDGLDGKQNASAELTVLAALNSSAVGRQLLEIATAAAALALIGGDNASNLATGTIPDARISAAIARIADPAFTGNPTAPTQAPGSDNTRLATTAFVQAALTALIGTAPAALNTLGELSDALADDPAAVATLTAAIAATVSDAAYNEATWNGVTTIGASKNALRDQIETLVAAIAAKVSDEAFDSSTWNGVTTVAASKNAVRDLFLTLASLSAGWSMDATGGVVAYTGPTFVELTGSGNWTPPDGASQFIVLGYSGGPGGGSGRKAATGDRYGGGGGMSALTAYGRFTLADLGGGAAIAYVAGTGGTGGAAKTTDGDGNAGGGGTASTFGGWTRSTQTWARSTTTITITSVAHNFAVGDKVTVANTSSAPALPNATYIVATVPSADTFTITGIDAGDAVGTCDITQAPYLETGTASGGAGGTATAGTGGSTATNKRTSFVYANGGSSSVSGTPTQPNGGHAGAGGGGGGLDTAGNSRPGGAGSGGTSGAGGASAASTVAGQFGARGRGDGGGGGGGGGGAGTTAGAAGARGGDGGFPGGAGGGGGASQGGDSGAGGDGGDGAWFIFCF